MSTILAAGRFPSIDDAPVLAEVESCAQCAVKGLFYVEAFDFDEVVQNAPEHDQDFLSDLCEGANEPVEIREYDAGLLCRCCAVKAGEEEE